MRNSGAWEALPTGLIDDPYEQPRAYRRDGDDGAKGKPKFGVKGKMEEWGSLPAGLLDDPYEQPLIFYNVMGFDNLAWAMLTIFQMITLE